MTGGPLAVCLYSPANLNRMSGSSIWVQAVAEALQAGPRVHLTVPSHSAERRGLVTDALRALERVEVIDPHDLRRYVPPGGLSTEEALDLIERLDATRHFEAFILRSFTTCLAAIRRPRLRGRLWSCYILEPERDGEDPRHLAEMTAIADASRYLVVQSEEMRALLEALLPAARGKTIILPPAIPPQGDGPTGPAPFVRRLLYAGKFHPFYPVGRIIQALTELRPAF
ncbi:MAG TPA: hypothetical protein VMH24_08660, partial [Candidatus Sulfotelmatobacter sp.]|nr:hypothetical protein [Candidatus Sulfotelmatobacter sp.]